MYCAAQVMPVSATAAGVATVADAFCPVHLMDDVSVPEVVDGGHVGSVLFSICVLVNGSRHSMHRQCCEWSSIFACASARCKAHCTSADPAMPYKSQRTSLYPLVPDLLSVLLHIWLISRVYGCVPPLCGCPRRTRQSSCIALSLGVTPGRSRGTRSGMLTS